MQEAVAGGHLDICAGGVRVLGDGGQRLADRVVGGDLDLVGQPTFTSTRRSTGIGQRRTVLLLLGVTVTAGA